MATADDLRAAKPDDRRPSAEGETPFAVPKSDDRLTLDQQAQVEEAVALFSRSLERSCDPNHRNFSGQVRASAIVSDGKLVRVDVTPVEERERPDLKIVRDRLTALQDGFRAARWCHALFCWTGQEEAARPDAVTFDDALAWARYPAPLCQTRSRRSKRDRLARLTERYVLFLTGHDDAPQRVESLVDAASEVLAELPPDLPGVAEHEADSSWSSWWPWLFRLFWSEPADLPRLAPRLLKVGHIVVPWGDAAALRDVAERYDVPAEWLAMGARPPFGVSELNDAAAGAALACDWLLRRLAGPDIALPETKDDASPFTDLLRWATAIHPETAKPGLTGKGLRVIQSVAAAGGTLPLKDLAHVPGIEWAEPWDNSFGKAKTAINLKFAAAGLPYEFCRIDNAAHIVRRP